MAGQAPVGRGGLGVSSLVFDDLPAPGGGMHWGRFMNVLDRFRLDGKVALVTGGARGLGRVMAEALGGAGGSVALSARNLDLATEVARGVAGSSGQKALGVAADVTRAEDVRAMVDRVLDAF